MPIIVEGPDDPFGTYSGCIHVVVENPNCRIRPRVVPEISAGADNGVRIMWDHDGEEHIETVALGWTANTPTFAYRTRAGAASGALDQCLCLVEGGHIQVHRVLNLSAQEELRYQAELGGYREAHLGAAACRREPIFANRADRALDHSEGKPRRRLVRGHLIIRRKAAAPTRSGHHLVHNRSDSHGSSRGNPLDDRAPSQVVVRISEEGEHRVR